MRIQRRFLGIAGLGAAALLTAAVSTGAASAAPTGPTTSPVIHKVATASKTVTEQPGTETADDVAEKPGTETADDVTEKPGTETADGSDGPGGHADPADAVDHQFEGNE